ncbi:MAG: cysteine--tRNA ligase [Erysipelotrichaceae bacterium]|nr:cysteine--tRNA ligase [Erysipelotrichaceae bacterium]
MKLYNSLSNKIEEFVPIVPNEVSMYVCGPTVYNHVHIGNTRPMIVFDTLRRLFEAQGYQVHFVSNYTDVDDKIINKAREEQQEETVIANRYIEAYQAIRDSLNIEKLSATPRVTQTMPEIIAFIGELIDSGYAYLVDGDVYFRVSKVANYGELSGQNIDDLQVGARIEENSKKENPLDFALWKVTDMGIKWSTPWGEGRPGWHTECVVMINKEFNKHTIDIHGGGMDLKFPHHENEIAQSEALYHTSIANYWLHNGMLNQDGEKMSKSLGNVVWAKDFIARLGSNVVRWLMLSAQYRSPLNISDDTIETAKTELNRVFTVLKQVDVKAQREQISGQESFDQEAFDHFIKAMNEDINTPNGFMEIFETMKVLNRELRQQPNDWNRITGLRNAIIKMLTVLGIVYVKPILTAEDTEQFNAWEAARLAKDYQKADEFRQALSAKGLI